MSNNMSEASFAMDFYFRLVPCVDFLGSGKG